VAAGVAFVPRAPGTRAQSRLPTAAAGGANYRIGADDVLVVSVLDSSELDQVVVVRPDGKASLVSDTAAR
jgi:hypothetical protein